jgi:hypothetical protein
MIHVGRLTDKIINRIKQLINLGYKDYQIVEDVGVSRQTVAKYRRVVLEEAREKAGAETAARVEEERRRREEREKKIRDHQTGLARARALKRQEEEEEEAQAEADRHQSKRIWMKIQKKKNEQETWSKVITEVDSIFTKVEARGRIQLMESYEQLYKEAHNPENKQAAFQMVVKSYGFPFTHFVYTEEEHQALPMLLHDRGNMDFLLKTGLWPYKRNPLTELIEGLRALTQ